MPDAAQRQLDALRADLEIRLAALEVALDDPAQSHTLPALILDLTRIATTEAEATAARACAGLKLEADMQMAQVRAAAHAAVEQASNVAGDLRRSLEQALQRVTSLEREKQSHDDAMRDAVETAVSEQRAAVMASEGLASRLERDLTRERAALESERSARAELRTALDRAEGEARALKAESVRFTAEQSSLNAALTSERQALAGAHRAHEETKTALASAQALIGELRYTLDETKKSADVIDLERNRTRNDHEALKQSFAELQKRAGKLEKAAADADARTAAERRLADQQRAATESATSRATILTADLEQMRQARDRANADLAAAQQHIAGLERAAATAEDRLLAEQRTVAELRTAVETASTRTLTLGAEQAQTRAVHESLTADLTAARQRVTDLEQSLAGAESRLLAEQRTTAELRSTVQAADSRSVSLSAEETQAREQLATDLSSARQRIADLEQSLAQADARLAAEQAAGATARAEAGAKAQAQKQGRDAGDAAPRKDLDAARGRIALLERTLADTESQLKSERQTLAQMRDSLGEGREGIIGRLIYEQTERRAEQTKMAAAIDQDRERAEALERACAESTAAIEAERAEAARLRKLIEQAQSDVAQVAIERDRERDEREGIRQELAAARAHGEALEADLRASQGRVDELSASLERASRTESRDGSAEHDPRTMARRSARFRTRPAFDTQGDAQDGGDEFDDARPTRLSIRYRFLEPIEIQVNGKGAILRDLSKGGCQLLSAAALRPNQTVKLAIPGDDAPIQCAGRVVWAQLQPASQGALCYRTGIQFTSADETAIEAFAAEYGTAD